MYSTPQDSVRRVPRYPHEESVQSTTQTNSSPLPPLAFSTSARKRSGFEAHLSPAAGLGDDGRIRFHAEVLSGVNFPNPK